MHHTALAEVIDVANRLGEGIQWNTLEQCVWIPDAWAHATFSPKLPRLATPTARPSTWSALWGAGQVARYAPDGQIDQVVLVPTRQPPCVTFGGPGLDLLFVTSAHDGLIAQARDQMAGHVFVYTTSYSGIIEPRYGGGTAENACENQRDTA